MNNSIHRSVGVLGIYYSLNWNDDEVHKGNCFLKFSVVAKQQVGLDSENNLDRYDI